MTADQLKQIIPGIPDKRIEAYLGFLNQFMPKYGIDTPLRQAAFIAQVAHESGSFRYVRELASGEQYEGRADLGNTQFGDGVKFRGHGLIQITGRTNHKLCSRALFGDDRLTSTPELLCTPQYAAESACWFWQSHGLNELADASNFDKITRLINGGLNGKADRDAFYERAKAAFLSTLA